MVSGRKERMRGEAAPGWNRWRPPWWPLAVLVAVVTLAIALFSLYVR
jgi:hypothetical protein